MVTAGPGRNLPQRERPGTHCTGGWVGHRFGLDGGKMWSPPGFDPEPPSPVSQSLCRLSYRTTDKVNTCGIKLYSHTELLIY